MKSITEICEELKALDAERTQGELQFVTEPGKHAVISAIRDNSPAVGVAVVFDKFNDKSGKQKKADAAYIVAACNAAPDLVAEIERLQALVIEKDMYIAGLELNIKTRR